MEDFVIRCDKRFNRNSKCGQIATVKVSQIINGKTIASKCRCSKCGSGFKTIIKDNIVTQLVEPIEHDWNKINLTLNPLVGKVIVSQWHRGRELRVKYIKHETKILMCQDTRFDGTSTLKSHSAWMAVYAKEITNVL